MNYVDVFKKEKDFGKRLKIVNEMIEDMKTNSDTLKKELKKITRILYEEGEKDYEEYKHIYYGEFGKDKETYIKEKINSFIVCASTFKSVNK